MRRIKFALTAFALVFLGTGWAQAQELETPRVRACQFNAGDGTLFVDWSDVDGAEKYSMSFVCLRTEIEDNRCTRSSVGFEFGTSDREDGFPFELSEIEFTIEQLEDLAGLIPGDLSGFECFVRVRALAPHAGLQGEWSRRRACGTAP